MTRAVIAKAPLRAVCKQAYPTRLAADAIVQSEAGVPAAPLRLDACARPEAGVDAKMAPCLPKTKWTAERLYHANWAPHALWPEEEAVWTT